MRFSMKLVVIVSGCFILAGCIHENEVSTQEKMGPVLVNPKFDMEEHLNSSNAFLNAAKITGNSSGFRCGNSDSGKKLSGALAKVSAVGSAYRIHTGTLSKRNYTWSIKKNFSGNTRYTMDASNAFVEDALNWSVSAWASVANLSFTRIASGGEITFEWVDVIPGYPDANGLCDVHPGFLQPNATGATIYFSESRTAPGGSTELQDWSAQNRILAIGMHEVGHFLGMAHAHSDTPYYTPGGCAGVSGCTHPTPSYNSSVMSYEGTGGGGYLPLFQYLSNYDTEVIRNKYGYSQWEPLLDLWIPSWNKHFYTNNWEEANQLVRSGFASDIERFTGALVAYSVNGVLHTPAVDEAAFHRHSTNESGVGPKHYYSTPNRLYAPTPIWYEGIMGYLYNSLGTNPNRVALYKYHNSSSKDDVYLSSPTPGPGYTFQGLVGYVRKFQNL